MNDCMLNGCGTRDPMGQLGAFAGEVRSAGHPCAEDHDQWLQHKRIKFGIISK